MGAQYVFLVSLLALSTNSLADRTLGSHAGFTSSVNDNFQCGSNAAIRIESQTKNVDASSADFLKIVGLTRSVLGFECSTIDVITVGVFHGAEEVSAYELSSSEGWKISEVSADSHSTAGASSDIDSINPVKSLGYIASERIFKGDKYELYHVSDDPSKMPRRRSDGKLLIPGYQFVAVHKIAHDEQIGGAFQLLDNSHQFSPEFVQEISSVLSKVQYFRSGTIRHYVDGYDVGGNIKNSPHLQAPIVSSRWNLVARSEGRAMSAILPFSENFSALNHCIDKMSQLGLDPRECEGYKEPDTILSHKGFRESELLIETPRYNLYSGRLPGSADWRSSKNRHIFIMEHNVGLDENFLPYNSDGFISEAWLKELSRHAPIADFISTLPEGGVIAKDFIHYVKDFSHPSGKIYGGVEQPIVVTKLRFDTVHKVIRQWDQGRTLSVNEAIAEAQRDQERDQKYADFVKRYPKLDYLTREKFVEQSHLEDAKYFGYVYKPLSYWQKITGVQGYSHLTRSSKVSELQKYHDGDFSAIIGGDSLALHYTQFVEIFGNACRHLLSSDHLEVPITSTTRTVNQWGDDVEAPRESTRYIYLDKEYVKPFSQLFSQINDNNTENKSLGEMLGSMLSLAQRPNDLADTANILLEPGKHLSAFFNEEPCDGPSMTQLRINLLRAASDALSIQQSQQTYDGKRRPVDQRTASLIYKESSGKGVMTFGYKNTPKNWLPESPDKLLKRVREEYVPYMLHHQGGWIPSLAHIEVVNAPFGSLEAMRISTYQNDDTLEMIRISSKMRELNLSFPDIASGQLVVECSYVGKSSVVYWYENYPQTAEAETLKAIHPDHPMLQIERPRDHCPSAGI